MSNLVADPTQVGVKIMLARMAARRMSRELLAQRMADVGYSINPRTIEKWEKNGVSHVTVELIGALAKSTGQSAGYFMGLEQLNEQPDLSGFSLCPEGGSFGLGTSLDIMMMTSLMG